ncbi:MAG TPA: hypothetical protein DDW81_09630 [Cryomorphaceae bacterium]|nr:hypothetical protein [Owenweeksia sp.]HBF20348.1 hypothetical protein [Cryomorphaceae bacterium]HCQ15619.1 hypothetical protein [Cryomorphaceae bacterium]|tara:strand:- start:508 stop:801 length:294 start_codon:yes stop_codon:yes gene_type:complete
MKTLEPKQRAEFIGGVYNTSEAKDIICSILNGYINFQKLQFIKNWEADHSSNGNLRNARIEELRKKKNELEEILTLSEQEGCSIQLLGTLEAKLVRE